MTKTRGTAGQRRRAAELIRLARAEFKGSLPNGGDLMQGEVKMLRGVALGEEVCLASNNETKLHWNTASQCGSSWGCWKTWNSRRDIRAIVLRWLCVSANEALFTEPTGVALRDARIHGILDLDGAKVAFRVGLFRCAIPDGFKAISANFARLSLDGSYLMNFVFDGITVKDDLSFKKGFRSFGFASIRGATIEGNLDCSGGQFRGVVHLHEGKKISLRADQIRVRGSVFFNNRFHSTGELNFMNSRISGNFECRSGRLISKQNTTLDLSNSNIDHMVFLDQGFHSNGTVKLLNVSIGGGLDCRGGIFKNPNGCALDLSHLSVRGNVLLILGFTSKGETKISRATIGSGLDCRGGKFLNPDGDCLVLEGTKISGAFISVSKGTKNLPQKIESAHFAGVVNLRYAQIDLLFDDLLKWPQMVVLTGCVYEAIDPGFLGIIAKRLEWLSKSDRFYIEHGVQDYLPDPQPYKQLAKVFRSQGHEEDARLVMRACARSRAIARFNNQIEKINSPILNKRIAQLLRFVQWCLGILNQILELALKLPLIRIFISLMTSVLRGGLRVGYGAIAGHGYNRWRPFAWMVGLILLGGFVFSGYRTGEFLGDANPKPTVMQQTQGLAIKNAQSSKIDEREWVKGYPVFRPLGYSADAFLPLVNLHQESYWTPKDGWVKRLYLPFHILAGWVVTTLAAVSVTGLVRHEKE